jgi:hypothetical protein
MEGWVVVGGSHALTDAEGLAPIAAAVDWAFERGLGIVTGPGSGAEALARRCAVGPVIAEPLLYWAPRRGERVVFLVGRGWLPAHAFVVARIAVEWVIPVFVYGVEAGNLPAIRGGRWHRSSSWPGWSRFLYEEEDWVDISTHL